MISGSDCIKTYNVMSEKLSFYAAFVHPGLWLMKNNVDFVYMGPPTDKPQILHSLQTQSLVYNGAS